MRNAEELVPWLNELDASLCVAAPGFWAHRDKYMAEFIELERLIGTLDSDQVRTLISSCREGIMADANARIAELEEINSENYVEVYQDEIWNTRVLMCEECSKMKGRVRFPVSRKSVKGEYVCDHCGKVQPVMVTVTGAAEIRANGTQVKLEPKKKKEADDGPQEFQG